MAAKTIDELRELFAESKRYVEANRHKLFKEAYEGEHKAACEKLIPIYRDRLNDPKRDPIIKRQDAENLEGFEESLARYDANHPLLVN